MTASLSAVARRFSFVRETEGPNAGYWVNLFQRFTGNAEGDSWCASALCFVLDIAYKGHSPLIKSASCQELLDDARAKGYVVQTPEIDDIYFYLDANGHAHHVGTVSNTRPLTGVAGNTSADGKSSNGDGWYEHEINAAHCVFVRLP